MATPDDILNIKINYLTFAICSASTRGKRQIIGYYSLRDPIHNNDIINNGHNVMAHAIFKKIFKTITFFLINGSCPALTAQLENRDKSLKDCKEDGKRTAARE